MRRSDREIKDFDAIIDVLARADTIRLGLRGEQYPYVVPLSFGLEVVDGAAAVYFHGAKEGLKHTLIAQDPRVCVEADICHRFAPVPDSVTTEYESVIGYGVCERLTGGAAGRGLDLLLAHCGFDGFEYDKTAAIEATAVYRVTLESVTGKRRFV